MTGMDRLKGRIHRVFKLGDERSGGFRAHIALCRKDDRAERAGLDGLALGGRVHRAHVDIAALGVFSDDAHRDIGLACRRCAAFRGKEAAVKANLIGDRNNVAQRVAHRQRHCDILACLDHRLVRTHVCRYRKGAEAEAEEHADCQRGRQNAFFHRIKILLL